MMALVFISATVFPAWVLWCGIGAIVWAYVVWLIASCCNTPDDHEYIPHRPFWKAPK